MMSNKLFQADTQVVSMLQNMKETIRSVCKQHTRHKVRIEALDGRVYEGQIIDCDNQNVYLEVEEQVHDQPELTLVSATYPYQPCFPYPYSPYAPYSPYTPWYPYSGYNPYLYGFQAPLEDTPDSSVYYAPRRRRRRRRVIPLALYTLLNIVLL
jgi:small nuclear ribonucleoprotein (snRNP)-like protein